MAKKQSTDQEGPSGIAAEALAALNEACTSTKAYQLGDHAEHTWGIEIPSLAFQWMIGGSSVFPCQRYLSVSGLPKSMKSTLIIEIGTWFAQQGGLFIPIDNESKTSASMLDAMTQWRLTPEQQKMILFKETESTEEWQDVTTAAISYAKDKLGTGQKGKRVPVFLTIDSLTGKASASEQEAVADEGHAEARGFPTRAAQITRYLETMQLTGTLMSVGYVRHLKQSIDGAAKPGMAPQMKETGGAAAGFKASLSIRISKGQGVQFASHPSMPYPNLTTEGNTLYMESNMSCLGPDKRKIKVDVLWQYVPQEDGSTRQLMKYDWGGALGELLWGMKYDDKGANKLYAGDKERLDSILYFVEGKGSKRIKCEALGLVDATFSEFGNAIEANPEVREKVARFLNIRKYNNVQDVDIEPAKAKK
jgi:hypothetical protein